MGKGLGKVGCELATTPVGGRNRTLMLAGCARKRDGGYRLVRQPTHPKISSMETRDFRDDLTAAADYDHWVIFLKRGSRKNAKEFPHPSPTSKD